MKLPNKQPARTGAAPVKPPVNPQSRTMSRASHLLVAVAVVFLSGCDARTKKLSLSDPRVAPMLQAMAAVDRAALGFAPIPTNATALLLIRTVAGYDAMLNIFDTPALNAGVHRTIGFRKTATGYKCILEQEVHPGPKTFTQSGNRDHQSHTAHESILFTYQTESLTGRPLGKLCVDYTGPDSRLAGRKGLTLDEVRPILAEWSQSRQP